MDWVFLLLGILLSLHAIRVCTTFVHEMGHGIAAYYYTRSKVTIYLGSYGNESNSRKIAIGPFAFWFCINPFKWQGGLCRYSLGTPAQNFRIILAGPLASLLLFACNLTAYQILLPEGIPGAILFLFCVWSAIVFVYNIVPHNNSFLLHNGNISYTDGARLLQMRQLSKMPPNLTLALEHYNVKQYTEAATLLHNLIKDGTKNRLIYRFCIAAYIALRDYEKADQLFSMQVDKIGNIGAEDRINHALIKAGLGRYDEAIQYYKHLLLTGEGNKFNLNNYAYTLLIIDRAAEAIPLLDKAIAIDIDFAYAYCNRALAKLMTGALQDGKTDNDRALALDPDNSDAHRNTGIYLLEQGNYAEAIVHLSKAKEMDSHTLKIDLYLQRATDRLKTA